jgi:RNA polymerase sigma factor (TIGR02999 family)
VTIHCTHLKFTQARLPAGNGIGGTAIALAYSRAEAAMTEPVQGPAQTSDVLFAEVYERLKAMAAHNLAAGGRHTPTLDTTVLVHELYLRMSANPRLSFEHPAQFFSYAARAMRHLLTDRARAHMSLRAGGHWMRLTLTTHNEPLVLESAEKVVALDAALDRLAAEDQRAAQVIELRYFAGLSAEQTAQALGISKRTADRDWSFAMAFLEAALA